MLTQADKHINKKEQNLMHHFFYRIPKQEEN
jgi:hypothetical protein